MPQPKFFIWLGLLSFLFLPLLYLLETSHYRTAEAYFASPVTPVEGHVFLRSDGYGKGYFGASRSGGRKHMGVDLKASIGDPVYAAKSGRVLYAGANNGYGMYVEILHPGGLSSRYAHLSTLHVHTGDWVPKGSQIGDCGKTGNAVNPHIEAHLHFEIHHSGQALNPAEGLLDPAINIQS